MPNWKTAKTLYALPSPLYAPGSPILIAGGALLEAEGLQYCRLRLQVIGEMRVRSVTAAVQPLDAAGEALGLELPHRFLGHPNSSIVALNWADAALSAACIFAGKARKVS